MLSDPHIGFVVAAYAAAAIVLAAMIGSVVIEDRRLRGELDQANRALEAARGAKDADR